MFGRSLLIAPKVWNFMDRYSVSLPEGDWYDYWSGTKVSGGKSIQVDPPLDTLPVYVRAGSIIPQQPVVQNTDETPRGPLVLHVYPGPQCQGGLYADDGNTLAYRKGQSMHVGFTCEAKADRLTVEISAPIGPYQPWFQEMQLEIHGTGGTITGVSAEHGTGGTIKGVSADQRSLTGWKAASDTLTLPPLKWANAAHTIEVQIEQKQRFERGSWPQSSEDKCCGGNYQRAFSGAATFLALVTHRVLGLHCDFCRRGAAAHSRACTPYTICAAVIGPTRHSIRIARSSHAGAHHSSTGFCASDSICVPSPICWRVVAQTPFVPSRTRGRCHGLCNEQVFRWWLG